VTALRYVTPLREGGSLPGIMEADDLGTYVVKFVGAGQGRKVLVAEVLVGELGRLLGLPVPELVLVEVDRDNRPTPSVPFVDPTRPRRLTWWADRYALPQVYWRRILRGRV